MRPERTEEVAQSLTHSAEQGDSNRLRDQFARMNPEERATIGHRMQAINADHVKDGLPKLDITFHDDAVGQDHLKSVTRVEERAAYSPMRIIGSKTSVDTLYDESASLDKLSAGVSAEKNEVIGIGAARELEDVYNKKGYMVDKIKDATSITRDTADLTSANHEFYVGNEPGDTQSRQMRFDSEGSYRDCIVDEWNDGRIRMRSTDGAYASFKEKNGEHTEVFADGGLTRKTSADGRKVTVTHRDGTGIEYNYSPGHYQKRVFDNNHPHDKRKNFVSGNFETQPTLLPPP